MELLSVNLSLVYSAWCQPFPELDETYHQSVMLFYSGSPKIHNDPFVVNFFH